MNSYVFRMEGKTESGIFTFSSGGSYWLSYCDSTKSITGAGRSDTSDFILKDAILIKSSINFDLQILQWRQSLEAFKLDSRR